MRLLTISAAILVAIGAGVLIGYFALDSGGGGTGPSAPPAGSTAVEASSANGSEEGIALAPEFGAGQLFEPASKNWITNGGSTMNERYSTLNEVNTNDVTRLKGVWMDHLHTATAANFSAEAQPLEYEGTLFISTGSDNVFAIDVRTGKVLWRYDAHLPSTVKVACCGWNNRGVALGGGMVYIAQLNGKLVALNQRTGVIEWIAEVAPPPSAYMLTAAPLYYHGRVYTSPSNGAHGMRGYISAYEAKTGKLDWRFYTIPGPGETGHETWPTSGADESSWKAGGGGVPSTPAVDPKLNMMYFSVGSPAPADGRARRGDNLFDSSIVALNTETGKLEWYYQEVHHDVWGYGAPSPVVLYDPRIHGKEYQAVAQPGQTGFLYVLDRKTGKPLFSGKEERVPYNADQLTAVEQPVSPLAFSPQTVSSEVLGELQATAAQHPGTRALKVRPGGIYEGSARGGHVATAVAPSVAGGDSWAPSSFDPWTDYYYVCSQSGAEVFAPPSEEPSTGAGQTDSSAALTTGFDTPGLLTAFDMETGKIAWQKHFPRSCYSGAVSTAGNLVFVGNNNGELQAFNAMTGDQLWSFQTGAGANDTVTPFEYEDREYIAFYAGGSRLAGTSHGDNVWLFSLEGTLGPEAGAGVQSDAAAGGSQTVHATTEAKATG